MVVHDASRGVPKGAVWVLVIALGLQLNYLQKPFHVDDTVVLYIARQVLANPLDPFSGELDWDGNVRSTFHVTTNPPLLSYYLAPLIWLGGEREWLLHLAMLLWQVLLWWGVVLLSQRFGVNPTLAAALVLLNPATIVSPNLMRDMPMVAVWTLGTAIFVQGSDRAQVYKMVWGALLAGCAALMKYSGLGAVLVLAIYVMIQRRPRHVWFVLWALLPSALWCIHNLFVYQRLHFISTMMRYDISTPLPDRVWGTVAGLGGVWLLWMWAGLVYRWGALYALALGVALAVGWGRWKLVQPVGDMEAAFWSATGAFLLALTLARAVALWRQQSLSALWAAWVLLAIGIGAPFAAARHLLPAIPPLVLLWCPETISNRLRRVTLVLALQTAFGMYAGWCDMQIAEVYRQASIVLPREYGVRAFIGHWGWMYYAQRAGLQQVSANRLPSDSGILLAVPTEGGDALVPPQLVPRLLYEESVGLTRSAHLATLPPRAGFYASLRGAPPFRWLPEGYREQFDLFRVGEEYR